MSFKIGANAIIVREYKLLLGQRINCFGSGTWGLPGGHLNEGEKIADAVKRELLEETGLTAHKVVLKNIVNQPANNGHYIQFGFEVEASGEPQLLEPELCAEWRWFEISDLPENIFAPHIDQIQLYLQGKYFLE